MIRAFFSWLCLGLYSASLAQGYLGHLSHLADQWDRSSITKACEPLCYVTGHLTGQTGNVCFEIAAVSALAWDHGTQAYFPELERYPEDFENIFFRCQVNPPSIETSEVIEECFPLPFKNQAAFQGYFQSENYFAHYRERILELFAPPQKTIDYIQEHYDWLVHHPHTVGVQLRYYRREVVEGYPQYGRRYLEKAMAHFPKDSLFIVSSDNLEFAKQNMPAWVENVYYLEEQLPHTELFLLSLCKHNIISNSTFGWWAAWLNQNPEKKVLYPAYWTDAATRYIFPVCPQAWTPIEASAEDL